MIKTFYLIITIIISLILEGYSINNMDYIVNNSILTTLTSNIFLRKYVKQWEKLNQTLFFGPNYNQNQLNLIYAYYKIANFNKAYNLIEKFINLNYINNNIDYVLYIKTLIYMKLNNHLVKNKYIYQYNISSKYALLAIEAINKLIFNYPNSNYVINAKIYIPYLTEQLAKYELSIINFYFNHKLYLTVITHVKQIILNYPHTQSTQSALILMQMAYQKLNYKN
ncbi:MAG: outer membrane protein assembly factor BamD [Candidatus Dasytiphilus stammeri]